MRERGNDTMESENRGSAWSLVMAGVLLVAAVFTYRAHLAQPYSRPAATVEALFAAAGGADLTGIERASIPSFYVGFVSHFGEAKRARVQQIYDYVYRLGLTAWRRYRALADEAAAAYYEALQARVNALGRDAFSRLSVDERMALIEDRAQYEGFIVSEGVKGLRPEDRERIKDIEAFRERRDRAAFIEREGWSLLPVADRELLVSPRALSQEDTREKVAFVDRVGLQLLDERLRRDIEGIPRGELADAAAFDFKHGQPLAVSFLRQAKIPLPPAATCRYPTADAQGSLFRGETASCAVTIRTSQMERPVTIVVTLEKSGFAWLVQEVEPALYDISWE